MQRHQDDHHSFSALNQYMSEVTSFPKLMNDEEIRLLSSLAQGGEGAQQARDRFVEGYQPLVIGLAKRFVRNCTHLELLDFVQEGNIGLLRAIERYQNTEASSFKTFVFAWVRGAMLTAYWQYERLIGLPLNKVRAIQQMNGVSMHLLGQLRREPLAVEVAREMGMKEQDVLTLLALREQSVVSLHLLLDEEGDVSLEEMVADTTLSFGSAEVSLSVNDLLDGLTKRERSVLQLRYGLVDGCAYTQQEVAKQLGMALSTVQMLDRRARMRLKKRLVA